MISLLYGQGSPFPGLPPSSAAAERPGDEAVDSHPDHARSQAVVAITVMETHIICNDSQGTAGTQTAGDRL